MVLVLLEEHEVGLPTYRTSQALQYCAFAYKARGDAQRLFGPWTLGGLLTTKLVAASRERQVLRLEVVVGGHVLEEVALLLHDAVELIDVLTELLSNTGEVAERDLVGVVVIEELEHLLDVLAESFSPILPVIIWSNSPNSMVPLPSPSMSATIFFSSSFLTSKPRARMAALSSRMSIMPEASASKRENASRISSSCSSESCPGFPM